MAGADMDLRLEKIALIVLVLGINSSIAVTTASGEEQSDYLRAMQKNQAANRNEAAQIKNKTQESAKSKWQYTSTTDKMRGTTSRIASLQSKNKLSFDFPYSGGPATLMLRRRPEDGLNIMLSINGQFICSSYSDDTVAVKFDEGPIEEFGCSEPVSGTTGLLFIEDSEKFAANLKASKTLIIEASFYRVGKRQMEFDVAGLDFEKSPAELQKEKADRERAENEKKGEELSVALEYEKKYQVNPSCFLARYLATAFEKANIAEKVQYWSQVCDMECPK